MAIVVEFKADGSTRIHEGANPSDFKGKSILVDPKFPKGIPPHQWRKHPEGHIEVVSEPIVKYTLPKPPKHKIDLTVIKYILTGLLGVLIGYLIHRG